MTDLIAVNFDVYRGERATVQFQVTPPRNVTGETHVFTMAKKENSATKLVAPTGIAWDDLTTGAGHFVLLPAMTDMKPAVYYWDVWRTDSGFEVCEAKGTITVLPETRVPTS